MTVLISGQAALAVLIHGDSATSFTYDEPDRMIPISPREIPYLFADAKDVTQFSDLSTEQAKLELESAWKKDRALQLVLILLSSDEDQDTRDLAADCLEELLEQEDLSRTILDKICISPLPAEADLAYAIENATNIRRVTLLRVLREIEDLQQYIEPCRKAWDNLSVKLLGTPQNKKAFELAAGQAGVFRRFAQAGTDRGQFDSAFLDSLRDLHKLPNSREILRAWTSSIRPERSGSKGIIRLGSEGGKKQAKAKHEVRTSKLTAHQAWKNVTKQKQGIIHLIKRGAVDNVRRYVRQLVQFQLEQGGPEYVVMSLCDLAQQAKEVLDHSLQLELAQKAVELLSTDGWAYGTLGDAYFCLDQYDNALRAYEQAIQNGNPAFGETGKARILRGRGLLSEALEAYSRLIIEFPLDHGAWIGKAEILRDLWRFNEALVVYELGVERFPQERILCCGRAAVLKELGRLEDSLKVYRANIVQFPDDVFSYAGKAEVLKEMGNLEEAKDVYVDACHRFPDEIVPLTGQAGVLRAMGHFEDALRIYDEAIANFRRIDFALCGRAEVLKDMGRSEEASQAFQKAMELFPRTAVAFCGKANLLEKSGKLEDALQAYDQAILHFPREVVAWSGRAEMLKELGYLEEALETYNKLLERSPYDRRLLNSKAAILVALLRYHEAEAVLPSTPPDLVSDWVAFHIRGMIHLRKGELEVAAEIFRKGLASCPWSQQLAYYRNALAITNLKRQNFEEAVRSIGNDDEPLSAALRIHALGLLGKKEEAKRAYLKIQNNCPSILVPLRNELASRYVAWSHPRKSDDWVFDEECKAILLRAA